MEHWLGGKSEQRTENIFMTSLPIKKHKIIILQKNSI